MVRRRPRYPNDSDYTTNSPSYYDDLARKQRLIKELAKRIWEYEKTLYETLEEIENVLNNYIEVIDGKIELIENMIGDGFNEVIENLLREWLDDGTLEHIINDQIFNHKADKKDLLKATLNSKLTFFSSPLYTEGRSTFGDCTLIEIPDDEGDYKYVLVDTHTPDRFKNYILPILKEKNIIKFDYVIISHWHTDHGGAIPDIADNFEIDNMIIPGETDFSRIPGMTPRHLNDALDKAEEYNINVFTPSENETIEIGMGKFTFFNTQYDNEYYQSFEGFPVNYNNFNLCFYYIHGNTRTLFTGDMGYYGQYKYKDYVTECDIYKVQHHGYDDFYNETFMKNVSPELAIITAGIESRQTKSWTYFINEKIDLHVTNKDILIEINNNGYQMITKFHSNPDTNYVGILDKTSSPGNKFLLKGNKEKGFFDIVRSEDMGMIKHNGSSLEVNSENIGYVFGITGTRIMPHYIMWMKFFYKGKILFYPMVGLHDYISWDYLYSKGLVYGTNDEGFLPPGGVLGYDLYLSSEDNSISTNTYDFLNEDSPLCNPGDTLILKGWLFEENNKEFTVISVSSNKIVVEEPLITENGNRLSRIFNKNKVVKQDASITIGKTTYRVRLMKGLGSDPANSYNNIDRGIVGNDNEWNSLILPLLEKGRANKWYYHSYARDENNNLVKYWGVGLDDTDLFLDLERGNRTWMQEVNDTRTLYRIVRGVNGRAENITSHGSYHQYNLNAWKPVLEVIEG